MFKARQASVYFILVTIFLDVLGIGLILPVLPELVRVFAADESQTAYLYGVLASIYALMQFLFAPVFGALSDRFGRRPIILSSLFGYGLDYLLLALAPGLVWLVVARIVSGIMGANITTANAYIADVSTDETRGRNFGFIGAAFGLGFVFGPALGGLLGSVSLRLPFYVAAALVLLNFLYGLFVLPESLPNDRRRPFSLKQANPIGGLGQLGKYPLVAGMAFAFVFFNLARLGMQTVWVLYTGYRWGWGELSNGLTLALVGVMTALVQVGLTQRVIKRFGERRTILMGLAVSCISFALYGLSSQGWMMLATIVFASLGGVAFPAIQSFIAGRVRPEEQGATQGALTSLQSLASIVGPVVSTAVFGYFTSPLAPFPLPGATFLLGSVLILITLVMVTRLFARHPAPQHAVGTPDGV